MTNRILFVDDDPALLRIFTRMFPAPQFRVETAPDGTSALSLLEVNPYDVVVVDYQMPFMNGAELLARVKTVRPEAVRILVTGLSDFKHAVEAVNRGEVFRIIRKPWQDDELRFSIRLALDLARLAAERNTLRLELVEKNLAVQRAHDQLVRLNGDLESIIHRRTVNLLDALTAALDMRDNETQLHSRRVSAYARRLAMALSLDEEARRVVEQGALLHDIGKIGVPDAVLLKPGALDAEEWRVMKRHPEIGGELLAPADFLDGARQIIVQHQEKFDGSGYPRGLRGEAICVGARIFAVVDAYDAITSDRPYRKGRSDEVARQEIGRVAGTQLDPGIVEAFLALPASTWQQIREQVVEEARLEEAA